MPPNEQTLRETEQKFPKRTAKAASTRERILESATHLFLQEGFSNTSLDKVAVEAGTTKPTVYSHFKSKQGLLDAIISRHAEQRLEKLDELLTLTGDPKHDLVQFGNFFLFDVLSPQKQRWDRLAAAEAMTNPEVGEIFYRVGPARLMKRLTSYLKTQTESGKLNVEKPERAAEQLVGLLLGIDILRMQIGQKPPGKPTLRKRCTEAIAVFLAAYGAGATHE